MKLAGVYAVQSDYKNRKRVGRGTGSGHGKTSGRGNKGQRSRSGFRRKWGHEGGQMPLLRRLPQRGFSNADWRVEYEVVNVGDLSRFRKGSVVTAVELAAAGFIAGPASHVKILGDGELAVALTVRAHRFSKQAQTKIDAAGGKTELIPGPKDPGDLRNSKNPKGSKASKGPESPKA